MERKIHSTNCICEYKYKQLEILDLINSKKITLFGGEHILDDQWNNDPLLLQIKKRYIIQRDLL